MSQSPQVGGKNKCSVNARYACNYGNIKSGKCPGYTVQTRVTSKKGATKYKMKWHNGGELEKPEGVNFTSSGPLGHGVGEGNQPDGDNTMCLPHDADGNVIGDSRTPNEYCEMYRTEGRQQRGCTQDSGRRRQRREQRGRRSPSPRRVRNQGVGVASMLRDLPDVDAAPARSRSRSRSPSRSPSRSSESSAENSGDFVDNYHIPVAINGENFRYLHVTPGFKIKKVKRDGEEMNGVFTTKTMRKGARLQYYGRKINKPRSGHDEYTVTIKRMQGDDIILDGDPAYASTAAKAVGMASFVNEPTTGQPNAELTYENDHAFIELIRNVKKNQEITVCYGPEYGKRLYKTSCPSGVPSGKQITAADWAEVFEPGNEVDPEELEQFSDYAGDYDDDYDGDYASERNNGGNNNNDANDAELIRLLYDEPRKRSSGLPDFDFDFDGVAFSRHLDKVQNLKGKEVSAEQLEAIGSYSPVVFEKLINRLSSGSSSGSSKSK